MKTIELIALGKLASRGLMAGASMLALALATPANAQALEELPQGAQEAADADDDEIVVTGSRIPRPGFDTVRPIEEISSEEIEARAFVNIADALTELPTVSPDAPGDQDQFVLGQSFVDLFGLGSQRTLTLVNGRRFVSSNPSAAAVTTSIDSGLQVDYGAIPSVLVERIDVAKLAGAAVYGSDAIAGTINVILKDDYEGIDLSAQYGIAEAGDLAQYQVSGVAGMNFADDRGNIAVAVEYDRNDSALYTDRPRFSRNVPTLVPFASALDIDNDGDPDTENRIYEGRLESYYSQFGAVAPFGLFLPAFGLGRLSDGNFYKFNEGGALASCTPGTNPAGDILTDYGGDCGANFFNNLTLRPEIERLNVAAIGHFDITDSIRLSLEGVYADIEALEPRNGFAINTALLPPPSNGLSFNTSNPFLPADARAILEGNGVTTFTLNRESDDLIDDGSLRGGSETWRVAGGLSGDFNLGERHFNWDVSAVFGRAELETSQFNILDARLRKAIDAVRNPSGQIVCGVNADADPANDDPACIPLNIFGDARLLNSAEAIAYVQGDGPSRTAAENEQRVFTASVTGELFNLPAGWVRVNVGLESRHESNQFSPDDTFRNGLGRLPAVGPSGGKLDTAEAFGEIVVPLTDPSMDVPFAHLLEASGSIRFVHDETESSDGTARTENDATVYEIGGRWAPIPDITFRGSYTSAIRSPALTELFRQDQTQFQFGNDPCGMSNVDSGVAPATRRANCIAAGIDPDTFSGFFTPFTGRASGNPDLEPERSKAFNIGAVIQPRWVPRLALSIDYYNIEIKDRITQFSLTQILNSCFDDPDFPNSQFCSDELFTRDPTTNLINFGRVKPFNASEANYEAVEGRLVYSTELADILGGGNLGGLGLDFSVLRQINSTVDLAGSVEGIDQVGSFGTPKWSGTMSATYSLDEFRLFWRTVWQDTPTFSSTNDAFITSFGPGDEDEVATLDDDITGDIGPRFIHYASLQFEVAERMRFQIGVDNVFDRKPSRIEQAAGFFGQDEIFGRRYTARVNVEF